MSYHLMFTLNGKPVDLTIEPHLTLLQVLRSQLLLTGTKEGCGTGDCGACTVLLDGRANLLVLEAGGRSGRPAGDHYRRAGHRRYPGTDPESLYRNRRAAMRILHPRNADVGDGAADEKSAPDRG